jgi:hypothetical protein|nr:MAG TPA: hypothetical protein [Caudoviricetes sp.]DAI76238.1 MAG TPA: hypothetical protein [Caudoviricetes sp.]
MGKRIGRNRHRLRMPQGASWAESLQNELGIRSPSFDGRCAYCGKLVKPGQWHWMRDEFGQLVKKCNNERYCSAHRKAECERSFRKAMMLYGIHC